jgi:hypothetical protein
MLLHEGEELVKIALHMLVKWSKRSGFVAGER